MPTPEERDGIIPSLDIFVKREKELTEEEEKAERVEYDINALRDKLDKIQGKTPHLDLTREEVVIVKVIKAAREIQEFLWSVDKLAGLEEYKRMFRKRVVKIEEISFDNPHWKVEFKKRLLQTAALAIKAISRIDNGELNYDGCFSDGTPSNLPEYATPVKDKPACQWCEDTGREKYYHDAGDHFGAGNANDGEWRYRPCKKCELGREIAREEGDR